MIEVGLRKVSINDDYEGLYLLQNLMNDEDLLVKPSDVYIDESNYGEWLKRVDYFSKCSEITYNIVPFTTYWITYDNKVIGLANIKHCLSDETRKVGGHIGIILSHDYRHLGLGLKTMKLLVEEARNEFNIEDVLITTSKKNIACQKVCEKLGATSFSDEEHKLYWLKKSK